MVGGFCAQQGTASENSEKLSKAIDALLIGRTIGINLNLQFNISNINYINIKDIK